MEIVTWISGVLWSVPPILWVSVLVLFAVGYLAAAIAGAVIAVANAIDKVKEGIQHLEIAVGGLESVFMAEYHLTEEPRSLSLILFDISKDLFDISKNLFRINESLPPRPSRILPMEYVIERGLPDEELTAHLRGLFPDEELTAHLQTWLLDHPEKARVWRIANPEGFRQMAEVLGPDVIKRVWPEEFPAQ